MYAQAQTHTPIGYYFLFFIFSVAFVSMTDLSTVWLALITCALFFLAGVFWFKNIKLVLFLGVVFSSSIYISKALIIPTEVYTPGLSIILADVFLLPFLVLWFVEKKIILKEKIHWGPMHHAPFYFLLWSCFSIVVSQDPFFTLLMSVVYIKYFLIFYAIVDYIKDPRYLKYALLAFALGICANFAFVVVEIFVGKVIVIQGAKSSAAVAAQLVFEQAGGVHAFRPSGFTGHPNALSNLMVMSLPTYLILLFLGKKFFNSLERLFLLIVFVFGVLVIIVTLSRAGWICFVVTMLYILYFGHKKGIVPKKYIRGTIIAGIVGGLIAVAVFPTIILRITESDQFSSKSRIIMMEQAALIIQRYPIFGVGMGEYNRAARSNVPESLSHFDKYLRDSILDGVVHNKYLVVMSETGIIGITLFLLMIWKLFKVTHQRDFWTDPVYYALSLGLSAGILGEAVFYLFDHFYGDPRFIMLFFLFGFQGAVVHLQQIKNDAMQGVSPA